MQGEKRAAGASRRSDSLFTADEGGHRIDGAGVWRVDDMEAAVRRADADPVDTKFGPPSIVRPPHACLDWLRPVMCAPRLAAACHVCLNWLRPVMCA
jgi:hypothetical protein